METPGFLVSLSSDLGSLLLSVSEFGPCSIRMQVETYQSTCDIIELFSVKVCPELNHDEVPNLIINFVHNGTIPAGAIATFACKDGYSLVGPESKECVEGDGWTPKDELLCTRN